MHAPSFGLATERIKILNKCRHDTKNTADFCLSAQQETFGIIKNVLTPLSIEISGRFPRLWDLLLCFRLLHVQNIVSGKFED